MNETLQIAPRQSLLSARRMTLNLTVRPDGRIDVRSCEVSAKRFRNRTSFPDSCTLNEVIVAKLAMAIRRCIDTMQDRSHVLSLPEFLVELPGLVLSGAHLLVNDLKDGSRHVILRFKEFLGTINAAFRMDIGFHEPVADHNERLATQVLVEICLPVLNLCRYKAVSELDTSVVAAQRMEEAARELEFHTELLKRFVFNSVTSRTAQDDGHHILADRDETYWLAPTGTI